MDDNEQFPLRKTSEEYRNELTDEQYHVTEEHGTEPPFSSELNDNKEQGVYRCVRCGAELFSSDNKFNSGTGWPSFDKPKDEINIGTTEDTSHMMNRTEVHCNKCGAHLGHVFPDGPEETTGQRYCINGTSLDFENKDE